LRYVFSRIGEGNETAIPVQTVQAVNVPLCWDCHISRQLVREYGNVVIPKHRPPYNI